MNKKDKKIKELESEITRLKSAVAELKILNEIAVSSGKAGNVDQILKLIVEKSIIAIEAEQGSIHLVTSNRNEPFITIIRQDDTSSLKHNYHIGASITGWVLINKESLIIENLKKDKRFESSQEEKSIIHSVLCVPIWYEGKIIGIMMLINKKNQKSFSQNDLTLISIISVQAGQLINNLRLQKEAIQKEKEAETLQELDKIKTNFFTNISHEFRTPLTLILGPSKQILERTRDDVIKENAALIHRSAKKLNLLANQLLDISKIEAGYMKLKVRDTNITSVVCDIVASFNSFAESKNISLNFRKEREEIKGYLDKDNFDKVLCNILSNAMKFTPEGGTVDVELRHHKRKLNNDLPGGLSRQAIEISVSDTGIGIPEEQLAKIFDRFYQVDHRLCGEAEGSGVGLSLTKELIELHKGEIFVESEGGKGSLFRVILPCCKEAYTALEIAEGLTPDQDSQGEEMTITGSDIYPGGSEEIKVIDREPGENGLPSLLIIEDNKDIRQYMSKILSESYLIYEASDGEEGLKKALEFIPDLIISDIMMPRMDGIKLCSMLKSDSRTSHISLILLTAKSAVKDKIEGLETGADDYITKPFNPELLKVKIKGLLEQRKRMQDYFRKYGYFGEEIKDVASLDKIFLDDTLRLIKLNLSDPSFSVESLASDLAVSRQLLYKKLISLTGESPNDLIKRIRLNKAMKLIECKSANISEIALEVGFSNPSYFAECFQKQFGFLPSQYYHKSPAH